MSTVDRERLRSIKTFPSLVKYLRDELEWPIESEKFDDLTFDYQPEELGLDADTAVKIKEIKQLRPLHSNQPWGIFFINFEPKSLPVVVLRRILRSLVVKKRQSASKSHQATWQLNDLLFISSYGESDHRDITFAHFSEDPRSGDLPTLRVLGWDDEDTVFHLEHAHQTLKEKLHWPEDTSDVERWRANWSQAFILRNREVITTAKGLAVRMAQLATSIRKRVNKVLSIESEKGPLRKLHAAFKEALIHDLTEDDFADMYAQTITYGLLSARVSRPADLIAVNVADMVPVTNPFLHDLLSTFLTVGGRKGKIDFDELGINEVVQALRDANMEAILRDFGDKNPQEDPVIRFYEDFLKEYDSKKRIQRGVFFTPRPVVSFIVRSVDEILRTEFGLADGLADTTTWGDMAKKHPGLKIPKGTKPGDPFVQILDSAVGTGTFLVEVISVIQKTMIAKWQKQGQAGKTIEQLWNQYVSDHLLPRLYGYELMMAPYAIAHMKVGLKLHETGYRFASHERARIYLTNSLEKAQDFSDRFEFDAPALAHEAHAVNAVKELKRFTVVIGNPPYSVNSANKNSPIDSCLDVYKQGLGEERNLKPLNDDYVKFLRCSQMILLQSGVGIIGMITNHSYTTARLFRGMRRSLLADFSQIRFLDLRGDVSRDPSMKDDKNVFDIQQGVGIGLYLRAPLMAGCIPSVLTYELSGSREVKYSWLATKSAFSAPWGIVTPRPELYEFKLVSEDISAEYQGFLLLNRFFETGNVGYQTHRDEFVIDLDRRGLENRIEAFREARGDEVQLSRRFEVRSNRDWELVSAHRKLREESDLSRLIQETLYRPFDLRYIFYASYMIDYDRRELMQHIIPPNVGLLVSKVFDEHEFTSVFVTKWIVESKVADRTRGSYLFPLRLNTMHEQLLSGPRQQGQWVSNFRVDFVSQLARSLGIDFRSLNPDISKNFINDTDVINWIYAILHSPSYRCRYAEFLKIDFPRLPLTSSLELFRALARLGGELVALHLMESPKLDKSMTKFVGSGHSEIEKISYSDKTVWIDKEQTQGFRGIPENVWNFHIGGYQVCEKWLKDRKGRTLSKGDIEHYHRIVVALSETIRLMAEIDKIIDAHGGWPGAFSASGAAQSSSKEDFPLAAESSPPYI